MMTVIDDSLAEKQELYFEAGDHRNLIHVNRDQFEVLMDKAVHARFCYRL
jgi:Ala-tRNA(Pro) deacylase